MRKFRKKSLLNFCFLIKSCKEKLVEISKSLGGQKCNFLVINFINFEMKICTKGIIEGSWKLLLKGKCCKNPETCLI